jgi:glycosyltransferase involved in cell wall biosynthesis
MALRILNVTQVYPPATEASGQAQKVQAVSRHLAQRGHRVTVLTARCDRTATLADGEVDVAWVSSSVRYRICTLNPAVVAFCIRRLRGFDIVHLYGVYDLLGPVVAAFCRRWDIPYILEPLGMFRPIVRNVALKRLYRQLFGWPVVRGASRVIATSELERDELIAEGIPVAQVVVRRNGIDPPGREALARGAFRREIGLDDEAPLVLYLGRLSRKKGLDLLIEAFSGLPAPATLAIVGPDDGDGCVRDLERLHARLGLDGRVLLLKPRFRADRYAAFADADVFVLPSRSENFGNAAAEAMACGVPVVVTERCGIASLVRDRAGIVVPCEVTALRSALARLIADQDLRDRLRAGAARASRALSWDEPVAQMDRLYIECIQAGGSPGP